MTRSSTRLRLLALVLVAALGFAVAPAAAAHASGPGSASFTVSADGSPVAFTGASLSGPDFAWGSTDMSGLVAFSDLALGDYTLTIPSSPAYQETVVTFSLTIDAPHWEQPVALTPWPTGTGAIDATVVDLATGAPLPGIAVWVGRNDAPGPSFNLATDALGQIHLTDLVDGTYFVSIPFSPGQMSTSTQVEIVGGGTVTIELPLLAADSTITGRVVDPEGNGVAGLWVSAGLLDATFMGSTNGLTDGDGYYTLPGAGAGLWQVGIAADSQWERAVLDLQVEAASTATAPDLVLVPRFTGTVSGLVASSDGIAESQEGGFFDVCVTVLQPDGTPVPEASTVTGGDSFYYFWVAPGDYTLYFEDCDADREPHGYQATYLGGSTTLAGATIVTVETNIDIWLNTTTLQPHAGFPEPDHDATPVRTRDLDEADEDLIEAPSTVRRSETVEIVVGPERAGQWVSAWLHSRPTQLGEWHQVSSEGTIEIAIPSTSRLGVHELVVQDADDEVIGWADVRVLRAA
jgi:hypothetical protein